MRDPDLALPVTARAVCAACATTVLTRRHLSLLSDSPERGDLFQNDPHVLDTHSRETHDDPSPRLPDLAHSEDFPENADHLLGAQLVYVVVAAEADSAGSFTAGASPSHSPCRLRREPECCCGPDDGPTTSLRQLGDLAV
jgi:hypothetical protein